MTWKRTIWLIFMIMLSVLLIIHFVLARQNIRGRAMTVMGLSSVFPTGEHAPIRDAQNSWQGYGFAGNFRIFYRPSPHAGDDFRKLAADHFSRAPLRQELSLFDGGLYALYKARKGYRMVCLFFRGNMNYWADMVSANSLHFSRRVFENFILNLEIEGEKASPAVAQQLGSLQRRISPFFMQTPGQLLAMIGGIFTLVLLVVVVVNLFSGSCPRRHDMPAEMCTPGATIVVRGFGRRQAMACCLCLQGESLVVYRFRRPFIKIDMPSERQHMVWKKKSLYYKNYRVILSEEGFQHWRSRLL
ncbi:MAG TPA: hypothetical protein VLQ89_00860 [Candidatus Binatia bacterium]|nr:hypothetical protein [Candidatus Binatia bacterium]